MSSFNDSSNTNAFMNLDGNMTLNEENEGVKWSSLQSSDVEISPEDSEADAAHQRRLTTAAHIPPPNPPPSWVDDSDAEETQKQAVIDLLRGNGAPEEDVQRFISTGRWEIFLPLCSMTDPDTNRPINKEEFFEAMKGLHEEVTKISSKKNRKKKRNPVINKQRRDQQ